MEFFPLLNANVASIAVDEAFLSMEPVGGYVQVIDVGRGAHDAVDQAKAASTPMWQRIP